MLPRLPPKPYKKKKRLILKFPKVCSLKLLHKEKHGYITVRDVAKYYQLDEDEVQRVLDYNDN